MKQEIDAVEIIAAITSYVSGLQTLSINIENIMRVAAELEKHKPTLNACADLMSIESFRRLFHDNVSCGQSVITIDDFQDVQWRIQKLLPSNDITELIHSIYKSLDSNE